MAFFGKEYKYERQENFEQFVEALGVSGEVANFVINNHPTQKLVQNDGGYTFSLVSPGRTTELNFKSGEEFEEKLPAGIVAKTKIVVDGNVATQTQKVPDGRVITVKREFFDDTAKATITLSTWDGAAYRYFKA